jgi:signal transduction histidine kinase
MLSTLPSNTTEAAEIAAILPPKTEARRRTLMIVDDEEGPRQSLRVVFKGDYNLLLASDGASAIEFAKTHKIDAAVLDIRMGGMSGIDLLERIKAVDPDIEVIMLTAFETTDTMRQALRLGACDYLNKPFDINTIRAAVASAMERRSLSTEIRANGQKLQELQRELQEQRLEEEIMRTRGEIYASIIHDINGPLTIISGLIQIINQRIGDEQMIEGEDLEIVRDRLKRITRQVTNCIEISRRYLSFLRQNPSDNVRVWVNQILVDLGELLKVHPNAKNNQLLIHPLPEDVMVQINGTDLIQIFLNLSVNALQCTNMHHTVEIRGQLLLHPLDLSLFQDGPEDRFVNRDGFKNIAPVLALSVQDNGPGVPPEVMPKIFEPYFTTQPRHMGTGLGLCIVQRLLKEGSGALHAHTKVGQGTVFTVYLPARTTSAEPAFKI